MPLMTCPKCERFHYVPGECLAPKQLRGGLDTLQIPRSGGPSSGPQATKDDKSRSGLTASHAKATKANRRDDALMAREVDGVVSRSSGGDGSPAPKSSRKADRHPPGYQAAKQKLYRERKKAKT